MCRCLQLRMVTRSVPLNFCWQMGHLVRGLGGGLAGCREILLQRLLLFLLVMSLLPSVAEELDALSARRR